MKARFTLFAAVLVLAPCLHAQPCPRSGWKAGYWSKLAAQSCREASAKNPIRVLSPDRRQTLLIDGNDVFLSRANGGAPQKLFAYYPGDEFLWSPDSMTILNTYCLGAAGPCRTASTSDMENEPDINEITKAAFLAAHQNHKEHDCYTWANIGALTWEPDSDNIVMIAEIPPSPQCVNHDEGYFESFIVSLSQKKVVKQYGMQETIHLWRKILGTGLRSDIQLVREDARLQQKQLVSR